VKKKGKGKGNKKPNRKMGKGKKNLEKAKKGE
jgi:hypothetical protein